MKKLLIMLSLLSTLCYGAEIIDEVVHIKEGERVNFKVENCSQVEVPTVRFSNNQIKGYCEPVICDISPAGGPFNRSGRALMIIRRNERETFACFKGGNAHEEAVQKAQELIGVKCEKITRSSYPNYYSENYCHD